MEGDWDFYEASLDEDRAFVMMDLAAEKQESHRHRLQIRVKMLQPRPDGLRSNEEAEALFASKIALPGRWPTAPARSSWRAWWPRATAR